MYCAGGVPLADAYSSVLLCGRLALERTTNAVDAIKLMGRLAVSMGYYAADWGGGDGSLGEGGEALTVIDPHEAWVFHVLSDDTGTSAVWVAQRVPQGHVRQLAGVACCIVLTPIDHPPLRPWNVTAGVCSGEPVRDPPRGPILEGLYVQRQPVGRGAAQ